MSTTRLSSKGQVMIPKHIRVVHCWEPGMELEVVECEGGVLLRPKAPFAATSLDEVAGCLPSQVYLGDEDIQKKLKDATRKAWNDGC